MAKNQIVSLDIGTNAIKLVQLEQTASGFRLVNAEVEAYPRQHAIEESPGEAISQALQRLWGRGQRRRDPVTLSIPRLFVTSRRLVNLPAAATDEQLPNLVAMQAETELPFRVESAVYDYHDVHRSDSNVSVELIAAKRETVQQHIDYLKPLGVVPKAVIPSSLATSVLAGTQQADLDDNTSDGMTIVLDIGAGRTDLCLMAGKMLRFSRSFTTGGNHLTHLYQQETDSDFEAAESRKIVNATLEGSAQSAAPTYEWGNRLVSELKRSITGAKRDLNINQDTFISEIWLCGGGSRITGLANYIADELQIPARLWNPLDAFRSLDADLSAGDNRRSNSESVNRFSDTLAVALGLGINALTHQISLDLLPKEERARLTQSEQQKRTLTAVAAGVVLLVGLGIGGLTLSRSHQAKTAALDQHIRSIRRAESNAKKTLAKDLAIADLLTPRSSPLDILRELSLRFADRTQVAWTTLNISRLDDLSQAKIAFNIEAKSHQDVSKMIRIMAQSGVFTNIKSGQVTSVQRNKKPIFQARITCNLAPDAVRTFAQSRHLDRENMQKDEQVARSNQASPSDNPQATKDGRQSPVVNRSSSEETPSGTIDKPQLDGNTHSEMRELRNEATTSDEEWEGKEIDDQMEVLEFKSPETEAEVAEAESSGTDAVDEKSDETDVVEAEFPETDIEEDR